MVWKAKGNKRGERHDYDIRSPKSEQLKAAAAAKRARKAAKRLAQHGG